MPTKKRKSLPAGRGARRQAPPSHRHRRVGQVTQIWWLAPFLPRLHGLDCRFPRPPLRASSSSRCGTCGQSGCSAGSSPSSAQIWWLAPFSAPFSALLRRLEKNGVAQNNYARLGVVIALTIFRAHPSGGTSEQSGVPPVEPSAPGLLPEWPQFPSDFRGKRFPAPSRVEPAAGRISLE